MDLTAGREPVLNATGIYSTELFANRSIDRIVEHGRYLQRFRAQQQRSQLEREQRRSESESGSGGGGGDDDPQHTADDDDVADPPSANPFLLVLAMQSIHSPLEAPAEWVAKYNWITNKDRRTLAGMTSCLDHHLNRVVDALDTAGMWEDTVFVFTADNGGPPYVANSNWPMRGGKWTMWEGGTHLAGFVHAPTRLPAKPKNFTGLVHQADWVPTLVGAAGAQVDPQGVAAHRLRTGHAHPDDLPPIDGFDLWSFFADEVNVTGPRTSVLLNVDVTNNDPNGTAPLNDPHGWSGYAGIRVGDFKLVLGDPGTPNSWCWPNQNATLLPGNNTVVTNSVVAPLYPPASFAERGDVREGLCPVDDGGGGGGGAAAAAAAAVAAVQDGGCPATDYDQCSCSYNGSVPSNRDRPLLFDLRHDPVGR